MNKRRAIPVVVGVALTVAIQTRAAGHHEESDQAQVATDAVVDFGSPQPQPTPAEKTHEVVPNEVTIAKGGTVTFRVNGGARNRDLSGQQEHDA